MLSETWLTEDFKDAEICPNGFEVFRCDRNHLITGKDRGGGALIKKELLANEMLFLM